MKNLFGMLMLIVPAFAHTNEISLSISNLKSTPATWQCIAAGYTAEYDVDYFWGDEMHTEELAKESALQNCFLKQCHISECWAFN